MRVISVIEDPKVIKEILDLSRVVSQ